MRRSVVFLVPLRGILEFEDLRVVFTLRFFAVFVDSGKRRAGGARADLLMAVSGISVWNKKFQMTTSENKLKTHT